MIGIFDSGEGGINTLKHLHRLCPKESLTLTADYERAPYGKRSREEILNITEERARGLFRLGAKKVLIGCCTASTVFSALPQALRESCIPIIAPTATAARLASKNRKVAVLATEATVRSRAFSDALNDCAVVEISAPELVELVEGRLGKLLTEDTVRIRLHQALEHGADTLILGCTHFSSLKDTISSLPEAARLTVIDAAEEGAKYTAELLKSRN